MTHQEITSDWIAVDWGTSQLRVWSMSPDNKVLAKASSDRGMASLQRSEFEGALLELVEPWLNTGTTDVIACGMVGSRQGWAEAPYRAVPCEPFGGSIALIANTDPRIRVRLIQGLRQDRPADVMRGEETQIAGFQALHPDFDGIICLPGTHTKWAEVSAGEIVSFKTFMTGELYSLLTKYSVLRHSVDSPDWSQDAFKLAVEDTMSRPERLASYLFSLRAESLLHDAAPVENKSRLSGVLVGAELAASRPYWLGQQVAIVGAKNISEVYFHALTLVGNSPRIVSAEEVTLAGLAAAHKTIKEVIS